MLNCIKTLFLNILEYSDWWMSEAHFKSPLALVKKGGLYGLVNLEGREVVPPVSPAPPAFKLLGGDFIAVLKMPLSAAS